MRALWRVVSGWALARGAARAGRDPDAAREAEVDPSRYETGAPAWAERGLIGALVLAGVLLAAFAVLLALDAGTQLLGISAGGGLAAIAAALILAGLRVVPQETAVEERPALGDPEARADDERLVARAADGISRRRLIAAAGGVAGTGLAAAAVVPVSALGPGPGVLDGDAPWRAGVELVDEEDQPVEAAALEVGAFLTAFPRGADKRELGSPVIVVRVEPAGLELPPARRGWAPLGIMAFSKICTHAGCAVSLFRHPLFEPQAQEPALVCPCHYSTFAVRRAAEVTLGPAGRPLPQLPLRVTDGRLVAAGPLSGPVGPAWWGTNG